MTLTILALKKNIDSDKGQKILIKKENVDNSE